jgi:hypothetical protein
LTGENILLGNKDDLSTLGDKLFCVLPARRYSHPIITAQFGHLSDLIYFNFQMLQNEIPTLFLPDAGNGPII